MKLKPTGLACLILALACIAGACAKPPTEEMNKAIEAVTRAENDANAVLYAPNSLAQARDAVGRMRTEADSKRYDAAKAAASEAVSAAERAIADGRAGAQRARDDAAALVAGLKPAIAETEQGLKSAQAANLPLDFDALDQRFDAARLNADQAEAALSGSQYGEAMDRSRSAQADLSDINQSLSQSVLATSRKK